MDCLTACFGTTGGGDDSPYGSWPSPITAKFITGSSVGLGSLKVDASGLYWLESRPQEGGRNVVVRYAPDDPQASERGGVDVTPKDNNVRTRVHEYGGGAFQLHKGGGILFSDFKTQRLHLALGDGEATVVTDKAPDGQYRYADYDVSEDGGSVVCVREDHGTDGKAKPVDVVNEVVTINLATGTEKVLATGRDFYAHPRVSPDGARLCYVAWNHPAMPWDATELRVASLADAAATPATEAHELIDGAAYSSGKGMSDSDVSVLTHTHTLARARARARALALALALTLTLTLTLFLTLSPSPSPSQVLQPAWHPSTGALY